MQSVVLSLPTKVDVAPSKFVAARHKGFHVNLTLSHAIKRRLHRILTPRSLTRGPPASTWEGIASVFDLYRREQIVDFSIHSVYLIGIVLNTENMILNAYRQHFWGNPFFFAANASFQLTPEKNGLDTVITANVAIKTKTIAYGIISHVMMVPLQ